MMSFGLLKNKSELLNKHRIKFLFFYYNNKYHVRIFFSLGSNGFQEEVPIIIIRKSNFKSV